MALLPVGASTTSPPSKDDTRSCQEMKEAAAPPAEASKTSPSAKYDAIVRLYFRNKIAFISRSLEIYYLRTLAGEQLSDADKVGWVEHYRQAEEILALRTVGAKLLLSGNDEYALATQDVPEFRRALADLQEGFPQVIFDLRVGMALSTIMLAEKHHKAPSQACAFSNFYLVSAREMVPDLAKAIDLNSAEITRLRGYLIQVQGRINAAC